MRQTSGVVCRCSLCWIPSTPRLGVSVGQGASVFTGDLLAFPSTCCGFAAVLRHVVGFPDLGLRRGLPPHLGLISRRRTCPPPPTLGGGEGDPGLVPTFTVHRSTGEVPSFAPAALPHLRRRPSVWPPHRHSEPASESTTHKWWSCTADRPTSTMLEPASRLWSFTRWFKPRLHLPVTLAGPGPSGGTDPSRRCRAAPTLPCVPRLRLPPASSRVWHECNLGHRTSPTGATRMTRPNVTANPTGPRTDRCISLRLQPLGAGDSRHR